jgi:hypothetical protein
MLRPQPKEFQYNHHPVEGRIHGSLSTGKEKYANLLTPVSIFFFLKCEPRAKDLPYSLIKEKFRSLEWLQHPKYKSLLSRHQITQTLGTRKHPKSNLTLNCV